jgi:hypothetical protein
VNVGPPYAELARKKSGECASEMCTVQLMHSTHANLYSSGKEIVAPKINTYTFTESQMS